MMRQKAFADVNPKTFRDAAEIIEQQKKLCQKYLHDPDGNYCTIGAVLKVLNIDTDKDYNNGELNDLPEVQMLGFALGEFYPRSRCVSSWNDRRGRTCAESAQFLRQAAELLEYERSEIY